MSVKLNEVDELLQRINELESRINALESNARIVECKELHILDAEGNRLISLSVNDENTGEILISSTSGNSGVQILGEDTNGGGYLEVFKDFSETIEPFCIPRRDAVRIRICREGLGGGGEVSTHRNHASNVTLGSGHGYAGEIWIEGEHDSECTGAGRIILGVNRVRDEGVILIQKSVYNHIEDEYEMETVTKIGHGRPPEARYAVDPHEKVRNIRANLPTPLSEDDDADEGECGCGSQ